MNDAIRVVMDRIEQNVFIRHLMIMQVPKEIACIIVTKKQRLEEQERQNKVVDEFVNTFAEGIQKVKSASMVQDIMMHPNVKEAIPRLGDIITDVYVPLDTTLTVQVKELHWSFKDNSTPYFSAIDDNQRVTYCKLHIFDPCWPSIASYQQPFISVDKPCRVYLKYVFFDTWDRYHLVHSPVIARIAGHPHLFRGGEVHPKRLD